MNDALLVNVLLDKIQNSESNSVCCLAKDNEHAELLSSTIEFYLPHYETYIVNGYELLPYDNAPISLDKISEVKQSLKECTHGGKIFICTFSAIVEKHPSAEEFMRDERVISKKSELNKEKLVKDLVDSGYIESSTTRGRGNFTVKRDIVDIYPIGFDKPVRIHFSGNTISKIYSFNASSQRNESEIEDFTYHTIYIVPFNDQSRQKFCEHHWNRFNNVKSTLYTSIKEGMMVPEAFFFMDYFANEVSSILSYLPLDTVYVTNIDLFRESAKYDELCQFRFEEVKEVQDALPPEETFYTQEMSEQVIEYDIQEIGSDTSAHYGSFSNGVVKQDSASETMSLLIECYNRVKKILICINSEAREKQVRILFNMKRIGIQKVSSYSDFLAKEEGAFYLFSDVPYGVRDNNNNHAVVSEQELFGTRSFTEIEYSETLENKLDDEVLETPRGFPITHIQKGVGRFVGLQTPDMEGIEGREYVKVEYADNSSIFVSIDKIDMLNDYRGLDPEHVPLDDGKGKKWLNQLSTLESDVQEVAESIIRNKVFHKTQKREPYKKSAHDYNKFCSGFPFMLTQDQHAAINDILDDLTSNVVMDRLLVGDVGYGKTEVAMRACFVVSKNEKQCCVIAPTSLLADQHYATFQKRFEGTGLKIALLARSSKSEERKVINGLKSGEIDIVIGTHRLLQADVEFSNLGLLVIDEEHRFGVKQKQKILSYKNDIDNLSLTATPIPRTLSSALHGIREVSTIRTAPSKRLSIRTEVHNFSLDKIKAAIQREMLRNGQVFFLHNNTKTISDITDELRGILPEARIEYAHGKMDEVELFELMERFRAHEFDVLVSTTIIETGIDIPNANTIIIERADRLGLAQMHQIRGRVGRGRRQGYAYLLRPEDGVVSDIAAQRLKAMEDNTNLGGGFSLSNIDMEIRGAGEILGDRQSGHINALGFDLYFKLLDETISRMQADPVFAMELLTENKDADISKMRSGDGERYLPELETNVQLESSIPSSYVEDESVRMYFYRKIIKARSHEEINAIVEEITDRYGDMPSEAKDVFDFFSAKRGFQELNITQIFRRRNTISLKSKRSLFTKDVEAKLSKEIRVLGIAILVDNKEIQVQQDSDAYRNITLNELYKGISEAMSDS